MKKSLLVLLVVARAVAAEPDVLEPVRVPVRVVERRDFDANTRFALEASRGAEPGFSLRFTGTPVRVERRACPEVVVELPAPDHAAFVVEARATVAGAPAPSTGWLPWERAGAGKIRVRVPVDAGAPAVDVRVVTGAPLPDHAEYAMLPDPLDPAPLGTRTPVFLAHGFSSGDTLLPFEPERNTDFQAFRGMPEYRNAFANFKFYYFSYRPWADYREMGVGMATEIKKVLATAPAGIPFLLVGRSGGAIPTRYAAADPELEPRVLGLITLCGAMRGSVGAALLHANGKVAERIGVPYWLLLKMTQRTYPFSPMLDSLTFDNFDGTIGQVGLEKYGLMQNSALGAFNAASRDASKLIAYMGDVKSLWGWGDYKVTDEIYRRTLAAYDPSWGSADPLVHKPSGTLQGEPVREIRLLPNRHHSEVLSDPALMKLIVADLYQFHRVQNFQALFAAPGAF